MVIYLYGKDSYRRNQKLKELIFAYREKHSAMDFLSVDFEEDEEGFARARDFLKQPSMFVDSKLLLARESNALDEKARKEWKKILKSELNSPKTFVIISDREPLKDFTFLFKDPVKKQHFGVLQGAKLNYFLEKEALQKKLKFEKNAWDFFIKSLGVDAEVFWRGVKELEKIALAGFQMPIAINDIEQVICPAEVKPVFETVQKFLQNPDYRKKLAILESFFLSGGAAAYFFNSAGFQTKGKELLYFADCDVKIKRGKIDYEEALTNFALT